MRALLMSGLSLVQPGPVGHNTAAAEENDGEPRGCIPGQHAAGVHRSSNQHVLPCIGSGPMHCFLCAHS